MALLFVCGHGHHPPNHPNNVFNIIVHAGPWNFMPATMYINLLRIRCAQTTYSHRISQGIVTAPDMRSGDIDYFAIDGRIQGSDSSLPQQLGLQGGYWRKQNSALERRAQILRDRVALHGLRNVRNHQRSALGEGQDGIEGSLCVQVGPQVVEGCDAAGYVLEVRVGEELVHRREHFAEIRVHFGR